MSETFAALEKRWNNISKLLFNEECGELSSFAPWLLENIESIGSRTSSVSGKEVISAPTDYAKDSKWLSFDEIDFGRKFEPLGINEIKDIDSLISALSERFCYTGNIFFGKSGNLEKSSNINDSFYIYNTARFGNSKYLAYCTIGRSNEDCFGCNAISESSSCVRCSHSHKNKRCFEVWMSQNTSDSYFSYGLNGCSHVLFSFNLKSRRYTIGNLSLDKPKYDSIKAKLISEMAEELKKDLRLPSLVDFVLKSEWEKPDISSQEKQFTSENKGKIEEAFQQTTKVLFGKPLFNVDDYAGWLTRHTRGVERVRSATGNDHLYIATYANYGKLPKDRLLCANEAVALGQQVKIQESELEGLSLGNIHEKIGGLAFFNVELMEGSNSNLIDCAISVDSANCYRSSVTEYCKNCGYSFWPRSSQNLFGCDSPFDSSFGINCYSCTQLTRCFEIDCCGYCSDLYFGHNCENVHQSMFCFNLKNRRNHIGNAEYSAVDYTKIKSSLFEQIHSELDKNKCLKWDIYNIGGRLL